MYVVAYSGKARRPRLHLRDGCYQARGLRFRDFELFDMDIVPQHLYGEYCHKCWPAEGPLTAAENLDDEADTSSGDGSASTSGDP